MSFFTAHVFQRFVWLASLLRNAKAAPVQSRGRKGCDGLAYFAGNDPAEMLRRHKDLVEQHKPMLFKHTGLRNAIGSSRWDPKELAKIAREDLREKSKITGSRPGAHGADVVEFGISTVGNLIFLDLLQGNSSSGYAFDRDDFFENPRAAQLRDEVDQWLRPFVHGSIDAAHDSDQLQLNVGAPQPPLLSLPTRYLFLGPNGTGVPPHHHAEAAVALLSGVKRWLLAPPIADGGALRLPYIGVAEWKSAGRPILHTSEGVIECEQHPGEILWLPEGWQHATANEGTEPILAVGLQSKIPVSRSAQLEQVAYKWIEKRDDKRALQVLKYAMKEYPTDARLFGLAASAMFRSAEPQGRPPANLTRVNVKAALAADHLARQAVKLSVGAIADPLDARTLCEVALYAGYTDEAAEFCPVAATSAPLSRKAAVLYGRWLVSKKRVHDAQVELQRAVEIPRWQDDRTGGGGASFHLGKLLMDTNHFHSAIPHLRRAVQEDPNNEEAKHALHYSGERADGACSVQGTCYVPIVQAAKKGPHPAQALLDEMDEL